MIADQDKKDIGQFMAAFWQFMKKHYDPNPNPDDPEWSEIVDEAAKLGKEYDGLLQHNLIIAFLDYLEGKQYQRRKVGR